MTKNLLWVCDWQTKLAPHLHDHTDAQVQVLNALQRVATLASNEPNAWGVLITEQVPEKLGHIVPDVLTLCESMPNYGGVKTKSRFSGAEAILDYTKSQSKPSSRLYILGAEAHICVLKTVLELIQNEHMPFESIIVIGDAVHSMSSEARSSALSAMRTLGPTVRLTTSLELTDTNGDNNESSVNGCFATWIDKPERLVALVGADVQSHPRIAVLKSLCQLHDIPFFEHSKAPNVDERDVLITVGNARETGSGWREYVKLLDFGTISSKDIPGISLTLESFMYMLVPDAQHPKFRPTLALVKESKALQER